MRGLLLLYLFSIAIPLAQGAGNTCSEIGKQLIVLESQIQDSRLKSCSNSKGTPCCDPAKPLTCQSNVELQTKYNELMGKMVIYEGLISIGKAMEADHKAIKKINKGELYKAKASVDRFLASYTKARLIDTSLAADFWMNENGSEYKGKSPEALISYIKKKCKRSDQKVRDFCAQVAELQNSGQENVYEVLESLSNFAQAEGHARISPADRVSEYDSYRDALKITIGDSPVDYRQEHPQIKKIKQIQKALESIPQGLSEEQAKLIAAQAKALDGLKVNYGNAVEGRGKFNEYLDRDLRNGLADFNQFSRTIFKKDKMLSNLEKLSNVFKNHKASSMAFIEDKIKEIPACKDSKDPHTCFKKECAAKNGGSCSQGSDARAAVALNQIQGQLAGLDGLKGIERSIESAKVCLEKPVSDSASCVDTLKRAIGLVAKDDVDELKSQLHNVESAIESMNEASHIDELKLSKAMGLMAYKSKGCLNSKDAIKVSDFKAACDNRRMESFSQEAIGLAAEAGRILEFTRNPYINKELTMPGKEFSAYKKAFLQRCEEGRANKKLCELYKKDEVISGRVAQKIRDAALELQASSAANRRMPAKADFSKAQTADPAAAFAKGFGVSLLTKGIPWFMHYDQMNTRHQYTMNYYENRLSYMQRQRDWLSSNNTIPYYTNYPVTNYGWGLYDYGQAANFGGSSTNAIFAQPDDFTQFNFRPATVMDPYGSSNFEGGFTTSAGFNFTS